MPFWAWVLVGSVAIVVVLGLVVALLAALQLVLPPEDQTGK